MFETIVWATDGSEYADRALPLVMELARVHESKIVAVHANEVLPGRAGGVTLYADEDELRQKLAHRVEELRAVGFAAQLHVETSTMRGIADLIVDASERVDGCLIVVATHGHVIGSVTRALMHKARCPVLAVPPLEEVPADAEPAAAVTTA